MPRLYLVTVRGEVTDERRQAAIVGLIDQGERLHCESVTIQKRSGRESHLEVTLTEGKNREIRRLFKALGHEVTRLRRIQYGPFTLGDLEPGGWRELPIEEGEDGTPSRTSSIANCSASDGRREAARRDVWGSPSGESRHEQRGEDQLAPPRLFRDPGLSSSPARCSHRAPCDRTAAPHSVSSSPDAPRDSPSRPRHRQTHPCCALCTPRPSGHTSTTMR